MKARRVDELMVRDVRTVRSDADVHELERLLLSERIHGVPVVDPDGKLVGVVSQTDLLAWHFTSGVDGASYYQEQTERPPAGLKFSDVRSARVDEVMSPVVHCICPDQPVTLAAARMIDRKVHRLIVVNESAEVLGIVSATDLLRAVPAVEEALDQARSERSVVPPGSTPT